MKKSMALMIALAVFAGAPAFAEGGKSCCVGKGKGEFAEKKVERMKEKLGLSDAQAAQIKTIYDSKQEKMRALWTETDNQVAAVLTPEQKTKYDEMKQKLQEKRAEKHGHKHDGEKA